MSPVPILFDVGMSTFATRCLYFSDLSTTKLSGYKIFFWLLSSLKWIPRCILLSIFWFEGGLGIYLFYLWILWVNCFIQEPNGKYPKWIHEERYVAQGLKRLHGLLRHLHVKNLKWKKWLDSCSIPHIQEADHRRHGSDVILHSAIFLWYFPGNQMKCHGLPTDALMEFTVSH